MGCDTYTDGSNVISCSYPCMYREGHPPHLQPLPYSLLWDDGLSQTSSISVDSLLHPTPANVIIPFLHLVVCLPVLCNVWVATLLFFVIRYQFTAWSDLPKPLSSSTSSVQYLQRVWLLSVGFVMHYQFAAWPDLPTPHSSSASSV